MKQSQVTFKDSIAAKLLKVVFGYYIIFALIVTLIQLGVEYYNVKDNVMKEVENLQTSFEGSLSEAIWTLNDAQLKSLLKGIWGNQVIVALRIDNYQKEKGDTQALEGWFIDRKGNYHIIDQEKEKSLPPMKEGAFSELILYEFPLKYIDEYKDAHDIGKAIFYSSSQVVIDRVKHGFIHAYPDVAHTAISPRVHVQDGPMYPCIGARKSVALSGRRFSAHYRKPLMARIAD